MGRVKLSNADDTYLFCRVKIPCPRHATMGTSYSYGLGRVRNYILFDGKECRAVVRAMVYSPPHFAMSPLSRKI